MNIALRTPLSAMPSRRHLMERALEPDLLIGMPHLTPNGLSETWLMKELGHRHWLLLARGMGMDTADFRTPEGEEAYAAICATSLTAARFDRVRANDVLTIRSRLSAVSHTQTSTTHVLSVEDHPVGTVELISAFVHRAIQGSNHSIARVAAPTPQARSFEDSRLAKDAADLRTGRLATYWGQPLGIPKPLRSMSFRPSLCQEFNGAGLFYFAEFQALADRAIEVWFPDRRPVVQRDVFFLGNIEKHEGVTFELMTCSEDDDTLHGQLRRESGALIAKIFSSSKALL